MTKFAFLSCLCLYLLCGAVAAQQGLARSTAKYAALVMSPRFAQWYDFSTRWSKDLFLHVEQDSIISRHAVRAMFKPVLANQQLYVGLTAMDTLNTIVACLMEAKRQYQLKLTQQQVSAPFLSFIDCAMKQQHDIMLAYLRQDTPSEQLSLNYRVRIQDCLAKLKPEELSPAQYAEYIWLAE